MRSCTAEPIVVLRREGGQSCIALDLLLPYFFPPLYNILCTPLRGSGLCVLFNTRSYCAILCVHPHKTSVQYSVYTPIKPLYNISCTPPYNILCTPLYNILCTPPNTSIQYFVYTLIKPPYNILCTPPYNILCTPL